MVQVFTRYLNLTSRVQEKNTFITKEHGLEVMQMPPQKHIIDSGATNVTSTTQTSVLLAKGVINPDPFTNNYECRAGSIIGALTIQLDVTPLYSVFGTNDMYFDWGLFFNINDQQTAPSMDNVMGSSGADMLNQVFHQDGCLIATPNSAGTAAHNVSQWRLQVKIPRSWSKLNRGDTIRLYFKFSQAQTCSVKIRCIYKEYFP